jgi:spore coat protein H
MPQRSRAVAALISCAILFAGTVLPVSAAPDDGDAKAKAAGGDLFGLSRVVPLHIEIATDEYEAMQPPAPAGGFGGPPPAPRERKPGERESERNLFGIEFRWARGAITAEGKTFKGVGLRYAGNASYMASAGGLKRSFLIDLDRADHAEFHGLRALQLQAGAFDPSPSPSSARPACPRRARRWPR